MALPLDVERDLKASTEAFQSLVWPRIRGHCGGGRLLAVEAPYRDDGPLGVLDSEAGIDFLQSTNEGLVFGLSARVQWCSWSFDSFSVRYSRDTDAVTEYAKRMAAFMALDHQPIWPRWTVQAFFSVQEPKRLLAAGVVTTTHLFNSLWLAELADDLLIRRTHGERFVAIGWDTIRERWPLYVWREGDDERGG